MILKELGWRQIGAPTASSTVQIWRKGWEPFCVEIEIFRAGEIRGRLAAPGLAVQGNMVFENMPSVEDAAKFMDKLLEAVTKALLAHQNGI
jgi:hypothetical protein